MYSLAIARTGLLDHEARSGEFDPLTAATEANDHKAYYPGAVPLHILMSGDRATGRLLGAQILGLRKAEISKRIDIIAAALFQNAFVEDLNDMDLSYTPPFSSPWDPVQMAAQTWVAVARDAVRNSCIEHAAQMRMKLRGSTDGDLCFLITTVRLSEPGSLDNPWRAIR
jgi:hypothetical protein